ncbi:hypothetical protein PCANC_03263 [Puccinia coronata f. sp. avenae]|uniref:DNA mismatch repair protein n=1 Tax=Puccinia coronata f. sp. avenae TaxID=200324 RepID=A0A2N5SGN7_9BASI|nr:hypothetical protein PCASD_14782 [Puccinia coronata f. sp. avenae]PLW55241.1 hypothetical protein PCANC_03263 [Puccinia coronata f. sp. avenae]
MFSSRFFPPNTQQEPHNKRLKQTHPTQEEQLEELPSLSQLGVYTNQPTSSTHAQQTQSQSRLPTKTRLEQFLNSASTTTPSNPIPKGTEQFRAKIATKACSHVKWEQPQSIWEPGAEQKKPLIRVKQLEEQIHEQQLPHHHANLNHDHAEDDETEETPVAGKKCAKSKGDDKIKLTQLEQQWAEFKKQYPHLVIFMEVGYKIRLFGADAVLASQVLSIGHLAIPGRETAFFPKTNLYVHLSRMIMAGHKVGLFTQSETRSLRNAEPPGKKGGSKSRVFSRQLSGVYSLSTWTETDPNGGALSTPETESVLVQNWITSFHATTDPHSRKEAHVQLSMVAICPQSGEILWDSWRDDPIRSMLETRMTYLRPVEILVPLSGLDASSEKLISWLINEHSAPVSPRLESAEKDYTPRSAYELVSSFCQPHTPKQKAHGSPKEGTSPTEQKNSAEPEFLHHIVELPDGVLIALAALIMHMKSYQLESVFRQPSQFKSFLSQSSMILDANTLKNLEIFENSTDHTERSSLFWVLDRTKTPMGRRLLKQWIGKPLVDINMLKERADAIEELIASHTHPVLIKMRRMLGQRLPDLEKSLVRIQYGKCTEKELLKFLEVMIELTATFGGVSLAKPVFRSPLLTEIFSGFASVRDQVIEYRSELDAKAILKGEYENMFTNDDELYPQLSDLKDCISCIHAELAEHLQSCRNTLQNPKLEFFTVGSDEMLVEVRLQHLDRVPESWMKLSSTRAVQRFRTPEAQRLLDERDKYQDLLIRAARGYFEGFLRAMEEAYAGLRAAINKLGLMDCLLSLAAVAAENKYCRPRIVPEPCIRLSAARHPIVEQNLDNPHPHVPNDCAFTHASLSTMILTGNNMGGKSVTAKMIGCIVLLAQMGSYVPAERATIGLFDGCYTRMGMSEELGQGRSAFMVEMNETAKILSMATARSLVIIDELGYGTSTYDGLAIANAVLHHLVTHIRCFTIFITHYPQLNELAIKYPKTVKSYHMKFMESPAGRSTEDEEGGMHPSRILFLYKLVAGLASKSHGIHVAHLAGLPPSVLHRARLEAQALEASMARKKEIHRVSLLRDLLLGLSSSCSSEKPPAPGDAHRPAARARISDLVSQAQALLSLSAE